MIRPLARMYLPNWGSDIFTTSADSLPMEAQPSGQKKMNLVLPEWKHDEESVSNEKSANIAPISGLDEKTELKVPEQAVHSTKQKL